MYAVEFQTRLHNGMISVPQQYQAQLPVQVRVIILADLQPLQSEDHAENSDDIIARLLKAPKLAHNFTPMTREDIMNAEKPACFVDSNIWLYAFLDMQEEKKRRAAAQLIDQTNIVISTQVINEVCRNLLKAGNFTEIEISEYIDSAYNRYRVIELTRNTLLHASVLRGQHAFSFWDSMIIASALEANVPVLYSEDMQDQLLVESRLRIVNPFKK